MDSDKHIKLEYFFIISARKKKDELVSLLLQNGARAVKTMYGKGSVKSNAFKDVFGFVPEENKIIITSILPSEKAAVLIEILDNEYNFDKPNTGIAYTVPIEGLSFK